MADKDETPQAEEPPDTKDSDVAPADDDEPREPNLFGIDLGRRGDRAEQTQRDEVDVPPIKKVKAAIRTLTERLASAASDRDDAASRAKPDDPKSKDEK
jgi:hypothetical protein